MNAQDWKNFVRNSWLAGIEPKEAIDLAFECAIPVSIEQEQEAKKEYDRLNHMFYFGLYSKGVI